MKIVPVCRDHSCCRLAVLASFSTCWVNFLPETLEFVIVSILYKNRKILPICFSKLHSMIFTLFSCSYVHLM